MASKLLAFPDPTPCCCNNVITFEIGVQGELVQGRDAPALREVLSAMMPVAAAQIDKSAKIYLCYPKTISQVTIIVRNLQMAHCFRTMT